MLGMAVGPRPTGSSSGSGYVATVRPASSQYPAQTAAAPVRTEPPIQGTLVPGNSLAQKLAWLQNSADSHSTYIVEVNADERIAPHTFEYRGGINITVVLRGVGGNRTIMLKSHGTMFTVRENVTLVLDNNITLQGHSGNTGRMVEINYRGTFKMNNGATITGNPRGGVRVEGTFEMSGGTIFGNTTSDDGGGVWVCCNTFIMTGGIISGNTASNGGGVHSTSSASTTIRGGTISGNTAREYGGGVYIHPSHNQFVKSGGTITGYKSDPINGNVVKDEEGNIKARRGYAIYVCCDSYQKRKETTAGPSVNFTKDGSGAWDE